MQTITIQDIINYSICPNFANFSKNNNQTNFYLKTNDFNLNTTVIEDSIKKIMLEGNQSRMNWKDCRSIITQMSSRYITGTKNKLPEKELIAHYKKIKKDAQIIQTWYTNYHSPNLNEYHQTRFFINFPFKLALSNNCIIQDIFSIISVGKHNLLIDIYKSEQKYRQETLYNDLSCHIKAWCYYKIINEIPNYYQRIVLYKSTLTPLNLYFDKKIMEKNEKIIRYITRGISERIFYPIRSHQCNLCKYSGICYL